LTAYQIGLQLVDAPVVTVSENFAKEFMSDPLQTEYFANNLQEVFRKNGIYGINNGLFVDFPPEYSPKNSYSIEEIKKIKLEKRNAALQILCSNFPKGRLGKLTYQSQSIANLPDGVPILMMSGRLDPFQKGFDIFLQAIEKFTKDEIKVVLTPLSINKSDLNYFLEISKTCDGNVVVFPHRLEKGYLELQMGSTFGIMPSIYEPFGAAIEYMVNGTVTIARDTGGLSDQIINKKSGFLYKENQHFYNLNSIIAYSQSCNNVQSRKQDLWVQSMVNKLYATIKEAISIYQNNPNDYYLMILEGFEQARRFNWQHTAKEYFKIFKKVRVVKP